MKKPARHSLLIAGLASCALGTQAFADNEAYTLGQIEVAGSQQADVAEKSTTVWRISAEDIERRGARTLDEALAQIPGLNIRTGGEGSPRIDMRGQRTRQIKLLVNGIPVNSNADGQFNPALIPVTQIDEIVVRSATSSVLYGEGGTAGVINVITRRGNADHTTANVDARFGTNASRAVSASVGGQAGALDWFISADHQEHGDTRLSTDYAGTAEQPRGKRRNSDLDSTTVTGNFGYQVNRDLKIGLGINAGDGSQGKPPGIYPSTDAFAQVPRYERYDNISQLSAQLSADWAITDRTRLRGWIYASQLRQDERRFDGSNYALLQSNRINGGFDKTSDSRSLGYHLQVEHLATDRLTLSAAVDTRRDSYGENGRIRDVAAGGGGGGGGGGGAGTFNIRALNFSQQTHVDTFSAEAAYKINDISGITAGAGWVSQRRDDGGSDQSAPIAALSGYIDVDPAWRLKGGLSRKARAPSLTQLYESSRGNPNLKMEESTTAEIGVVWKAGTQTTVDATVFNSAIRNFIQPDSNSIQQNQDRFRNTGLEVLARTAIGKGTISAGYTYLSAKNLVNAESRTLQYLPRHRLTLDAWQPLTDKLSWFGSLLYVTDQTYYSRTGTLRSAELPSYVLVNTRMSYDIDKKTQLYVGIDNLFERDYATAYGFPQPGRSAYAGMRVRF